jgi:flagellar biosynthesis/type III secretory pathway chaperone
VQNVMKQQDSLITQLRSAEQAARTDIRVMKRTGADESSNRHLNEQLLIEAEQKLKLADHSVGIAKKRNVELQNRCDELSTQWEAERKLR